MVFVFFVNFVRNATVRHRTLTNDRFLTKLTKATKTTKSAAPMKDSDTSFSLLLYDGTCGFCNRTIQTVLRFDQQQTMRFAALQSRLAQTILARHTELQGIDSLILIEFCGSPKEQIFIRSTAALRVARYLGGLWNLLLLGYLVPRPVRDYCYDQFARRRYRWFGKSDRCMLPSPEERARFIDVV